MKCKNCSEEIPDGSAFCNLCGIKQYEDIVESQINAVERMLASTGHSFSAKGRLNCREWISTFGFDEVCKAVGISLSQYLEVDNTGKPIESTVSKVFDKIPGICYNRKLSVEKPYSSDARRLLAYSNKKFSLTERQEQAYKDNLERLFYLFSKKAGDYKAMYEEVYWKLRKSTDKWEFLEDVEDMIEIWEIDN